MHSVLIREFGRSSYDTVFQSMRDFTDTRAPDTLDEFWCLEHEPVFTQGQAGKAEHIKQAGSIPVVQSDRGGQVTYHGPGQLVLYTLVDVQRKTLGIRALVCAIEKATIAFLKPFGIEGKTIDRMPGVYVEGAKICSLGLRIRKGCSYHGLSLNVDMDLQPFSQINPCGFINLPVTQLRDCMKPSLQDTQALDFKAIRQQMIVCLAEELGYTQIEYA